jgi:hypothetical protein
MLMRPSASGVLARQLRTRAGAPIGDVFAFVSSLYFRGKLAYATAFSRAPAAEPWMGALVITQNRGMVPPTTAVTALHLEAFAATDIKAGAPDFTRPFVRDARLVADALGPDGEAVLLGSVASSKYVDALLDVLGDRLVFPSAFVGRGDMSRGGLLLRAVDAREELAYTRVRGAVRHGRRPDKLAPRER